MRKKTTTITKEKDAKRSSQSKNRRHIDTRTHSCASTKYNTTQYGASSVKFQRKKKQNKRERGREDANLKSKIV